MKILAICSTIDFKNFVRRATLEVLCRTHSDNDFLFFTGLRNSLKRKETIEGPNFYSYHFWVPERLKNNRSLTRLEYLIRGNRWRAFFDNYDVIFMIDPNQYYLLEFVQNQKVMYLLRDPNILLGKHNYDKEKKVLESSDLILTISNELKNYYLKKYYQIDSKVKYWPNCLDLQLWDFETLKHIPKYGDLTVGVSGNLTFKTDLKLLDKISTELNDVQFVLIGKNKMSKEKNDFFQKILNKDNVTYKGYLPQERVPGEVAKWHVGIMIERNDIEFSRYFNANKIYQYLAMGLPSVKYRYNDELRNFSDLVKEVETQEDYINAITWALNKRDDQRFQKECVILANENSADKRAEMFLKWVKSL